MRATYPGPKTLDTLKRGVKLFARGAHFEKEMERATRRGYKSPRQIVVDRAKGDFIWDMDGRKFIDFQCGWATNPLGNAHPEIIEAVHKAHERYGFHYDHPLRYDLAEKLATIMPGQELPRFNYEVSGTEAAEAAVHLALTHTKRRYIIAFSASFHGNSIAGKVLSAYDSEPMQYLEAWDGGVIRAPFPNSDHLPPGMDEASYTEYCLHYLRYHIPRYIAQKDAIAGIIIEPGLAEGGNWIPHTNFIQGIREICDENDWLMIADEVLTGLGRTGKMWSVEHFDVIPDIMVVGKNLSGGIEPCAGIAARDEILGVAEDFSSGSTFAGTPAGCAAGLKTLELYERDGVIEHAVKLGSIANEIMADWADKYEIVSQVRSHGLLMGVGFKHPEDRSEDWVAARAVRGRMFSENWVVARAVRGRMLENGVWAISDREESIRMYPALNMDEKNLREGLSIMEEAIQYVSQHALYEGDGPAWPSGVAGF